MEKKIKVLLADSRELFREGLMKVLGEAPHIDVVAVCSSGEETIHKAIELKPDIILLDGNIVSCDCVEVSRRVKELLTETRIIIFTPLSHEYRDPLFVLNADADGYVDIDVNTIRLVNTITRVHEGGYAMSPTLAERLIKESPLLKERTKTVHEIGLSKREEEVLNLVAHGLTNKEIASSLFVTENTIKAHLHNILKKMRVHTRQQAAFMAREKGVISD